MIKLYDFINKCNPKDITVKIKYHRAYQTDITLYSGILSAAEESMVFDFADKVYEATQHQFDELNIMQFTFAKTQLIITVI